MLRFAPSPTSDMHIDSLRIAIFNHIYAIQRNEELLIRIEDGDKEKNIEGKDTEIVGLLDLFKIKYQRVTYQSDHLKYHRQMAIDLIQKKIAFNCFCTPAALALSKDGYSGACENLSPEQTIDNENPFTVRLKKPTVDVEFTDLINGTMKFTPIEVDSFNILNTDKHPTYNFACAADDMITDISLVIRSEEYLLNTSKQIATRAALAYNKEVVYAHVPVILNVNGEKMSIEEDAANVKWLLEEGFLPEAIINYLILLGNTTPKEIFTLEEATQWFDLAKLSTSPARFDLDKLRLINQEHIKMMDSRELSTYMGFADPDIGEIAKIYLDEVSTTKALKAKVAAIFAPKNGDSKYQTSVEKIKEIIKAANYFDKFSAFEQHLMNESDLKGEDFSIAMRIVLTGEQNGPDLEALYPFIKNYLLELVK